MEGDRSHLKNIGWSVSMTYGALLVGSSVLIIVTTMLQSIGYSITDSSVARIVLSTILLQGVTFSSLAIAYVSLRGFGMEFIPFRIPDKRELEVTALGILGIFILFAIASLIARSMGLDSAQNQIVTTGRENPQLFLLMIPLSLILVGPGEELLYRGIIQGTLRESFGPVIAITGASALFASIHLFSLTGGGKLVYIGIAFLLAILLGLIYDYTENLVVPAIVHGIYNAIQFAGAYSATTGGL